MEQTKIDIVIPVYKPGSEFSDLIKRLMHQTVVPEHIFIMQTIRDESEIMVQSMDERIRIIPVMQSEFDHGGTRALEHGQIYCRVCLNDDAGCSSGR